jgi:hypothetical protein
MPRKRAATPAKPPPGPYRIFDFTDGVSIRTTVDGLDVPVATFWDSDAWQKPNRSRANANAQAFIAGQAAIETLEKMRGVLKLGSVYIHHSVIARILDEEPKSC